MRGRVLLLLLVAMLVDGGCGGASLDKAGGSLPSDHSAALWKSLPPGWSSFPAPPFVRARAVSVWTGRELFYWGGDTHYGGTAHADGAAFEPASRTWRPLPRGPLAGRSSAAAVWNGREILVWGGRAGETEWGDGAGFDPVSGDWRRLPASPLSPRVPTAAVWTGREFIVWGDASRSGRATQREGAAYDPSSDRWRLLPLAPAGLNQAEGIWTGKEMIVFGARLDGDNKADTDHAQGMAYDPKANTWRRLASHPLSPQASSVVWTGKEVVAWDYELEAGAYDPARDTWTTVPVLPLRFYECYPQSAQAADAIVAWFCGQGAILASTGGWRRMPRAPGEIYGRPVAAGGVVLFAGAAHEGEANGLWAFKPAEKPS